MVKKKEAKKEKAGFLRISLAKIVLTLLLGLYDYYVVIPNAERACKWVVTQLVCTNNLYSYLNNINIPLYFGTLMASAVGISSYMVLAVGVLVQIFIFYLISCALVWLFNKIFRRSY